jgi:4-alpha-glucanotransferase
MLTRLARAARVDVDGGSVSDAVSGSYAALAASPCSLVAVTLDDVLEVAERPNVPGTADRANWCLALPSPLEAVEGDQRAAHVSGLMRAARPVVDAEAVP